MATLDRRDYVKSMLGGAALLTVAAPTLVMVAEEKESAAPAAHAAFWKRVDAAKARELVESVSKAARAQVETQRAVNAGQRAAILVGSGADAEYRKKAAMHYDTRTAELRKAKDALSRFAKANGETGERHFSSFAEKGGLKEFTAKARKSTIESLLHSDISADEARDAVKTLDERLGAIQQLKSFSEVTSYLDHHLDELLERKMPDQDPNGFCVLILIISSLYAALLVVAVIICIFTLGQGCDTIFNELIASICGP